MPLPIRYIIPISHIQEDDEPLVGLRATRLGLIHTTSAYTPPGFVVTTSAFHQYLSEHHLHQQLHTLWNSRLGDNPTELTRLSDRLRELILKHPIPSEIAQQIMHQYLKLGQNFQHREVALRSSVTLDWQSDHPHADHLTSMTHVWGESNVVIAVRDCWANFFTPKILEQYAHKQLNNFNFGLAIIIQEMVPSLVSGTLLTLDPIHNDKTKIIIEAVYGSSEILAHDDIEPDYYQITKDSWEITDHHTHPQLHQYAYTNKDWTTVPVPLHQQSLSKLTDAQISELAQLARQLEHRFLMPVEIDWALTSHGLTIIETKSLHLTDHSPQHHVDKPIHHLTAIAQGDPAYPGLISGYLRHVHNPSDLRQVHPGDIALLPYTDSDYLDVFAHTSAVLTIETGQTSHAAMTARELHIPCIVGLHDQLKHLKSGTLITIDGRTGKIYRGGHRHPHSKITIQKHHAHIHTLTQTIHPTATHQYLSITPDLDLTQLDLKPTSGIGYISMDDILSELTAHPGYLAHHKQLSELTQKLVHYLQTPLQLAAPHPCIYHLSSLTTDHYMLLNHSQAYESLESDSLIGFRGAQRHLSQTDIFDAELAALKHLRNKLSCKNISLALPWVRTPAELLSLKRHIAAFGLVRGPSLKLYLCIDTPLAGLALDEFVHYGIDGIIIQTHHLLPLLLGGNLRSTENPLGYIPHESGTEPLISQIVTNARHHRLDTLIHFTSLPTQAHLNHLIKQSLSGVIASPGLTHTLDSMLKEAEHFHLTTK